MNEVDLLGEGGFGSCRIAQDRSTERMFAIKQNKNERFDSIKDECFVLSRLPEHNNIIQFLGAVLDEKELEFQPPLVCKMMMELAESKLFLEVTEKRKSGAALLLKLLFPFDVVLITINML